MHYDHFDGRMFPSADTVEELDRVARQAYDRKAWARRRRRNERIKWAVVWALFLAIAAVCVYLGAGGPSWPE